METLVRNFVGALSKSDLIARQASCHEIYIRRYVSALVPLDSDPEFAAVIKYAIMKVNAALAAWNNEKTCNIGLINHGIPWNVVINVDPQVEAFMPHTLGTVIIIPRDLASKYDIEKVAQIMLHEKIHVFQRVYPDRTAELLGLLGYSRRCFAWQLPSDELAIRSNPDVDAWVYEDKHGRSAFRALTNHGADGLRSTGTLVWEKDGGFRWLGGQDYDDHPFEIMASDLSEIIIPVSTQPLLRRVPSEIPVYVRWLHQC